jgi:hypothetical protein
MDFKKLTHPFPGSHIWHYQDTSMPIEVMLNTTFFNALAGAVDPGNFLYIVGGNGAAIRYIISVSPFGVNLGKPQ